MLCVVEKDGIVVTDFKPVRVGVTNLVCDVNADVVVDKFDIEFVTKLIAGSKQIVRPADLDWNESADVNKDGVIDAQYLVRIHSDYTKKEY